MPAAAHSPLLVAFLDPAVIQSAIFFVVRVVLGVLAGLLTWFVSGPLIRLLHRLALRRPAASSFVFVGRLSAAVVVGILVFLYFPIGGGGLGWGWGPGLGGGPGAGPGRGGTGREAGTGKGKVTAPEKTRRESMPEKTPRETGKDVLTIEIITSRRYEAGSGRYYLIDSKEPARTLAEIEEVLAGGKGRWAQVRIILYANSLAEETAPVQAVERLVERHGLPLLRPPEFLKKRKTFPDQDR